MYEEGVTSGSLETGPLLVVIELLPQAINFFVHYEHCHDVDCIYVLGKLININEWSFLELLFVTSVEEKSIFPS